MDGLSKLSHTVTSESVETMLSCLTLCSESSSMAQTELDYCDKKTQDLLHELELSPMSYHERAKLANQLMDIRQRRRAAKDIIELCAPLEAWITSQQPAINALKKCLGEMRKIETKQENRIYYKRANDGT